MTTRILQMATFAVILGCSFASHAFGTQEPVTTSTGGLSSDAWTIIAVGAALGAVGITCLVLLVSMTHKFTDLSNRLTAVEVTLKLREKNDGNGEWLQNAVRNLSHELIRAMRHEMRRELRTN